MKREGLGKKEARMIAARLDCKGAAIYGLDVEDWDEICSGGLLFGGPEGSEKMWSGRRQEREKREEGYEIGKRIWGMLKRRRGEEGAVPERVRALNGW